MYVVRQSRVCAHHENIWRGTRDIALLILNLAVLSPQKEPAVTII
jgi:hypothetical protein